MKMFAALFCVYSDYWNSNRGPNNIQKTSLSSYKTQIKILPFPGLADMGFNKPSSATTLLGWPKSTCIYQNYTLYMKNTLTGWTGMRLVIERGYC